jgi:hypothetical protein
MQISMTSGLARLVSVALVFGLVSIAQAKTVAEDGSRSPNTDFSSVNKSLRVGSDAEVGDLDAVNGSIHVGSGSIAGKIDSVNGGIKIESGSQVESVESVNGGINLASDVVVERDIETVNGGINMRDGGEIGGDVSSVNGQIRLNDVTLNGAITTYNGKIELQGNTEVLGGITVKKSRNGGGYFKRDKPTVISIGPNVVIHGDLHFERSVELHVDSSAKIGEIHGQEFIKDGYYR